MKRQSEELFFKYLTKPKGSDNGIEFAIPDDYNLIPGDLIELIISENGNYGGVSYYAKIVCYRPNFGSDVGFDLDVAPLSGKLTAAAGGFTDLYAATTGYNGSGKLSSIILYSKEGTNVLIDSNADHVVNMIVHRSKAVIDLYYL